MKILLSALVLFLHFRLYSQLKTYDFPRPVDTEDKEILIQEKKTYRIGSSLSVDNLFDGARINNLTISNDSSFTVFIEPENSPINSSPWYAFRLITSGNSSKNAYATIAYPEGHKHRYWPKFSSNSDAWQLMDSTFVSISNDSTSFEVRIPLSTDTIFISAQPLETSASVEKWCRDIQNHNQVEFETIGESRLGRPIYHLKIGSGKKAVIVLSRQHPPEVTGYYALKSFVSEILRKSRLSDKFLKEYSVYVYPLLNPDGVDMGHWRHNATGVDLNRDWSYYRQQEIRTVANHIVETIENTKSKVVLGLDFHSTWYDVYYTPDRSIELVNQDFTDNWLKYIERKLKDYSVNDQPSGLQAPVSKGWFITQFNAPGITFEIGDDTPVDFIDEKGKVAAIGLMKILNKYD